MMEATGLAEKFLSANLHGVISHNRFTFTLTSVKISELTLKLLSTQFFVEFFCAGLDESGFEARQRREIFSLHFESPDRLFGAHKASR
jgi:hypothetical protein